MTFDTEIELNGTTATGFTVPADVVESFGQGKRPKVVVTINGHSYRSTVAVYGGKFMLPLSAANRSAAAVAAGERVEVTLVLDTAERTVDVPDDLLIALDSAGVRTQFDALSFSKRNERVTAVTSAKRPQTRTARIAKIVAEFTE